jgi:hypothetical protein
MKVARKGPTARYGRDKSRDCYIKNKEKRKKEEKKEEKVFRPKKTTSKPFPASQPNDIKNTAKGHG